MNEIMKPIGLRKAVMVIEELCANCIPYENARVSPMLIELDAGNGQTTFTRYAAQMLIKHKIRQVVGLNTYLEFKVDSRKDRMQVMFGEIDSAAQGVNHFESVIAFDVTELCECIHEEQTDYFLKCLQNVAEHAVVLIYISSAKAKSAAKYGLLVKKLKETITNLQTIEIEPYTNAELAQMVMTKIDDYGIDIEDEEVFNEKLEQAVANCELACARDTAVIAEKLVKQARVNRFSAVLDVSGLGRALPGLCKKGGGI